MKGIEYIAIMILFTCLCGCNMFHTRQAEPPQSTEEWHAFTLSVPMALENLQWAWTDQRNLSNYAYILADSFVFVPDYRDITDYDLPESWGITTETSLLTNIFNSLSENGTITLELADDPDREDRYFTQEAEIYRIYHLQCRHTVSGVPTEVSGYMHLTLGESNGFWAITRWEDQRSTASDTATWGRLKHAFTS